jgi:carbon monoxide dehydrogenase subunit G
VAAVRVAAERSIDAPADVVYQCIANYQEHHRPEGFLPPNFSEFRVGRGGVGAGTVISFKMTLGGQTRGMTASVSEPEPGRVLVETGKGVTTTFTVEPEGGRCRVRFDTRLEATGIDGIMTRLFAPRMLKPVYADELRRLEAYAQQQVRAAAPSS